MFGIKEIISMFIGKNNLSQEQRFKILKSNTAHPEVIAYLIDKFKNLTIEILGDYEGNIMDLMNKELLEGWCWQTTETSIVFLNDDDYIERGNLYFENNKIYYHSWICFKYKHAEYVFDPCLNLLCKKTIYSKIFRTDVKAKIPSKVVREYLINGIQNPKPKIETVYSKRTEEFMRKFFGRALDEQREYQMVETSNNINEPMYRHNTGYKAVIEDGKIKSLVAHYYRNDG